MTIPPPAVQSTRRASHRIRLAVSVLLAVAALWWCLAHINFGDFLRAIARINHFEFLGFMLAFTVATVAVDSFAIRRVYSRYIGTIDFSTLFALRSTSHLASIVNYHLGQAWLTWLISRNHGTPVWCVAGVTLLGYGSIFGALILLTTISFAMRPDTFPWLGPLLVSVLTAASVYAVTLHLFRKQLGKIPSLRVLVSAGFGGHILAVLERLPHVAVLFLGQWIPFRFFGVDVPTPDALALVPILLLVGAMPITPQGVGVRDVVAIQLFTQYASGTPKEAAATIAAYSVSWAVALTLGQAAISVALAPLAHRKIAKLK